MQAADPHILAAMDGKEVDKHDLQLIPAIDRKEPSAFFFVIFGLVYEALVTASVDASSESRSEVISALIALKCLVRPEYAGQAIMEPAIFEEFISLCYRIGITETAGIQIHLIEMLAIFTAAQQHSLSTELDVLSLTSPPAHCLRICSHILKQATSPLRASSTRKFHFALCVTTRFLRSTYREPALRSHRCYLECYSCFHIDC